METLSNRHLSPSPPEVKLRELKGTSETIPKKLFIATSGVREDLAEVEGVTLDVQCRMVIAVRSSALTEALSID